MSDINKFLIKRVYITNFRGYKEKEYIFSDEQIVLLGGPNGYGKTSLVDAIEWVMTGTVKRIADEFKKRKDTGLSYNKKGLIAYIGADINDVCVEMTIQLDNDLYILKRKPGENPNLLLESKNSVVVITKDDGTVVEFKDIFSENLGNRYNAHHVCSYEKNVRLYEKSRNDMYEFFEAYFIDNPCIDVFKNKLDTLKNNIDEEIKNYENEALKNKAIVDAMQNSYDIQEYISKVDEYDSAILSYVDGVIDIDLAKDKLEKLQQKRKLFLDYNEYLKENKIVQYYDAKNRLENYEQNVYNLKEMYFSTYIKAREWNDSKCCTIKETFDTKIQEIINTENSPFGARKAVKLFHEITNFELFSTPEFLKNEINLVDYIEQEDEYNVLVSKIKLLEHHETTHKAMGKLLEYANDWKKYVEETRCCPLCGRENLDVKELQESLKVVEAGIDQSQKDLVNARRIKNDIELGIKKQKDTIVSLIKKRGGYWKVGVSNLNALYKKCISYEETLALYEISEDQISLDRINERHLYYKESLEKVAIADHDKELNEKSIRTSYAVHKGSIDNSLYKELIRKGHEFDSNSIDKTSNIISCLEGIIKATENNGYLLKYNNILGLIKKENDLKVRIENLKKKIDSAIGIYEGQIAANVNSVINDIYKKISRHSSIDKVNIERPKGMTQNMNITVQNKVNFTNIMSTGQLTTFSLSLFIGMAMLNGEPNFKAYFFDDPIQSMDDLNMLSFVDLLKNQIKASDGFAEQIFITTCDYDFVNLLTYKMKAGGVKVKYIDFMESK
ncbi:AAA family ATPase [uncultured Clostridium sp.]|uniref:AAA family ATPase n=1 Tax=uncultured Clostridium sp. TaxID=59620 RepID=UPI003217FEFA